jgi:hypothetical protein
MSAVELVETPDSGSPKQRRRRLLKREDEPMIQTTEVMAREATIAELKRLITSRTYETLETLEEAVDAFLWSEYDQRQAEPPHLAR